MREGLASEFPAAARAAAWTRGRARGRRPALRTEPIVWAAISGIGAGFLLGAVAQALVALTSEALQALQTLRNPMPTLFPLVTIAGNAAAAAVALSVGGLRALAVYLAYVAFGLALGIPGVMLFCERSGGSGFTPLLGPSQCTIPGFVVSLWPQLIGIGLGIALSRAITARGDGINGVLRIAGGFAVAQFVMNHVWAATAAQSTNPVTSGLTLAAGMAAAAVAAGVVAAQLPGGVRNAAIVAGVWLLPWLFRQVATAFQSAGTAVPAEFAGAIMITVFATPLAAALLVLSAAITSRARFIPRDTA